LVAAVFGRIIGRRANMRWVAGTGGLESLEQLPAVVLFFLDEKDAEDLTCKW
jgi:hypothetical protein